MMVHDPSLEQMATVLPNARIRNGVLRAGCPAHGGEDPNLSAKYEGDKLLIKCHSHGCAFRDIVGAIHERLGTAPSDDVPITRPSKPHAARPEKKRSVRRQTWDVRDEAGNLVAHHVRDDLPDGKKIVRWQMPNGTWKLDRGTAELPLYGADVAAQAPWNAPVVVCEGEKATDALRAAGFYAVGTVTGAEGVPDAAALAVLKNRPVVLWPDNDQVGYEHMGRVAEGLVGVAAEIRWLEWEGAPEKGDAADHPPEGLAELIASAPRWSKPPAIEGRAFLGQAITGGVEPPEELLPDLLLAGKAHNVYAPGGVGKTWVLVWIACELMRRGRKVAIFDLENGLRTYAERFEEMGADPDTLDELVYYWPFPRLDSARYAEMLEGERPDLVMFDSWIGFLASEGRDENVSNDISMWAEDYLKPALRKGSGVLLLDHVPHEHERERGSSRKRDEMDVVWQLTKVGDFDRENTATLVVTRQKDREGYLPERLTFEIGGDPSTGFVMRRDDSLARKVEVTHVTQREKAAIEALAKFPEGAKAGEWLEALNGLLDEEVSRRTLYRLRDSLLQKKKIEEVQMETSFGGVRNVRYLCAAQPAQPTDQGAREDVRVVRPPTGGDTMPRTSSLGQSPADQPSISEDDRTSEDEEREY